MNHEDSGLPSMAANEMDSESRTDIRQGYGTDLMSSTSLVGNDVRNAANEDLGDIKDLMMDMPSGRVSYAVLSFGGILGMGEKLFAVPWEALKLDRENKCFILDVDKDRLEDAPGFSDDAWPNMADHAWAKKVHSYYGIEPR